MNKNLYQNLLTIFLVIVAYFPVANCQEINQIESLTNGENNDSSSRLNSQTQTELPLTLNDAVYLALQNNRELKIVYLQRILEQRDLAESESIFNPTFTPQIEVNSTINQTGDEQLNTELGKISANLNWRLPTGGNLTFTWQGQTQFTDSNEDNNTLNQGLNIGFRQPLLRGFGVDFNEISIAKARLTEKANLLAFHNNIAQTITTTILTYRRLILAQETLKIEELSLENARQDLARLTALYEFGRIARNELVERQSDIAQQELNLVTTQNNLEQVITELNKLLDLPTSQKLVAIETPQTPEQKNLPSFEQMLEMALNNSNTYLSAINGIENAKYGIMEATNQQLWDLQLNVNYGFNSSNNTEDTRNLTTALTLNREFGNLSQNNAVERSEISLQTAEYTLTNTRENVKRELTTKIRDINDSFQQIKLAQDARELAQTKVNNAQERKRLGQNITMTDLIQFEQNLVDAKNQELKAIIDHLNQLTQLEQFLGITLNTWGVIPEEHS